MRGISVVAEGAAPVSGEQLVKDEMDGLLAAVQVLETLTFMAEQNGNLVQEIEWGLAKSILFDLVKAVMDADDPEWDADALNARISVIASRITGLPPEEMNALRLAEQAKMDAEEGHAHA